MSAPTQQEPRVALLTQENILQHEASQGGHVVYIHASDDGNPQNDVVFMMGGGYASLSASRPKTCGIALAMVALFCYFPGISMTVTVAYSGVTNKAVIGIVFTGIALTLTVVSAILCVKSHLVSRKMARKFKHPDFISPDQANETSPDPSLPPNFDTGSTPLISNRQDDVLDVAVPSPRQSKCQAKKRDPIDVLLANKIAHSIVLQRYFENMRSVSGPFSLNREEMDRLTEGALLDNSGTMALPDQHRAKFLENTSSADSAIEIDSELPSNEMQFDVQYLLVDDA